MQRSRCVVSLLEVSLGHFQVKSYRYRSLLEALYTLSSPHVVSLKLGFRASESN